jgi:hypothetical protein
MASGHVNRTAGRNGSTDQACDVTISLANPEPSTHGHLADVGALLKVRFAPILLQNSKIEPLRKSRES